MDHLERAIEAAGGVVALASAIGVSDSAPHMWRKRGKVPAEHCPAIERETRRIADERGDQSLIVTCEDLRPDIDWSVVRQNATPSVPAAETTVDRRHPADLPVTLAMSGHEVAAPPAEGDKVDA